MAASRLNDLALKFRAHGGRLTPQRMAILRELLAADHPTVEAIYEAVKRDFPMTSIVTVYRTVDLLRDWGEALEVESADPLAHYDAHRPYHHPHLVCVSCGRVTDAPDLSTSALTEDVRRKCQAWALSDEVHFYGLCPACQARGASGDAKGGETEGGNPISS